MKAAVENTVEIDVSRVMNFSTISGLSGDAIRMSELSMSVDIFLTSFAASAVRKSCVSCMMALTSCGVVS